ncbi:RidA family protein [Stutzerimonas azotifigens]|uniref:RidA family protein n=1 Tax=Stutzerimonas azotifigens TaxID=291995 RepID=UPI0003F9C7D4|nr:RidA family protein [Stutzerimonas azotifigens]
MKHLARALLVTAVMATASGAMAQARESVPTAVEHLTIPGGITATGPWGLATKAGDFLYVAGMRGIDAQTNKLVEGDEARIRQAYMNMKHVVESQGTSLQNAVRITVYVTDMFRFRPIANKIQEELWGKGPYPPRSIIEVQRLNQDDILEVEGTFYIPPEKP